ncbi:MAG: hypothetical protein ABR498_02235, partial [Candidatus Dormibacteria bacterium]
MEPLVDGEVDEALVSPDPLDVPPSLPDVDGVPPEVDVDAEPPSFEPSLEDPDPSFWAAAPFVLPVRLVPSSPDALPVSPEPVALVPLWPPAAPSSVTGLVL